MSDLTFEDVDALLKRDWFVSMEDINELFWTIPEDVFRKVDARKFSYPLRTRLWLGCAISGKSRLRVVDE